MAFQVSPGVNVSEIDATNVVPAVSTSDAGFAAAFLWGPADKITTVTSEVELAKYFGKPSSTDVEKNWHVASNFLAYAGSLNVVRTLGANSTNAIDTLSDGDISTLSDTTPTPVGGAWTIIKQQLPLMQHQRVVVVLLQVLEKQLLVLRQIVLEIQQFL